MSSKFARSICAVALACAVGTAFGAIVNVPPGAGLSAAITAAASGDELRLTTGTYTVPTTTISFSKNLTIRGGFDATFTNQTGDRTQSVIDGTNASPNRVMNVTGGTTRFENLTMANANQTQTVGTTRVDGAFLYINGSANVTLDRVVVRNNQTNRDIAAANGGRGPGVWVSGSSNVTITNSLFKDNIAGSRAAGLYVGPSNTTLRCSVSDSQFETNHSNDLGVSLYNNGCAVTLTRCTFDGDTVDNPADNPTDASVAVAGPGVLTMTDCVVRDSRCGVFAFLAGRADLLRCRFESNATATSWHPSGAYLQGDGTVMNATDCVFTRGNSVGGIGGAIYMQNATTANLTNCIFDSNLSDGYGSEFSLLGGTVNMTGGEIKGSSQNCAIYLQGIGATPPDVFVPVVFNATGVKFHDNVSTNGGFRGIIWMRNGALGSFTKCLFANNVTANPGGAVGMTGGITDPTQGPGTKITLEKCRFENNMSDFSGHALYVDSDVRNDTTVSDCYFEGNGDSVASGVIQVEGGVFNMDCSRLFFNPAAGLVFFDTTGVVDRNVLLANGGTGMYVANTATGISDITLTNNLICGNATVSSGFYSTDGGGLTIGSTFATVHSTNNSITGNYAYDPAGGGGGIKVDGGTLNLKNTLVWGNFANTTPPNAGMGNEILVVNAGFVNSDHNNVKNDANDVVGMIYPVGVGDISADPMVADLENCDAHPLAGSPLIAGGEAVTGLTIDLNGNARPGTPAIGAYERVTVPSSQTVITNDWNGTGTPRDGGQFVHMVFTPTGDTISTYEEVLPFSNGQYQIMGCLPAGTYDACVDGVTLVRDGTTDVLGLAPSTYVSVAGSATSVGTGVLGVGFVLKSGDTNGDGIIDDADITNAILDFGFTPGTNTGGALTDVTGDGAVDDADLTVIILNYGEADACP